MKRRKALVISLFILLLVSLVPIYVFSQNNHLESTTEQAKVISKENNQKEQWIILEDSKRIYIETFSVWALLEVGNNYLIRYEEKKPGQYNLKEIVPENFEGQF